MVKCSEPPVLPGCHPCAHPGHWEGPRSRLGCQQRPNPSTAQTPPCFSTDTSLLAKQHFFLALGKRCSLGETTDRVLDQKVTGIKRAKADVPQSHAPGAAPAAVGLEVALPAPCPGTPSMLGMAPSRDLGFSRGSVALPASLVGGRCSPHCRRSHLPAAPCVHGHSWSDASCKSSTTRVTYRYMYFHICPAVKI